MRIFNDKTGYKVNVTSISGCNDFEGVLESTPKLARRHRYRQAERDREKGIFYWDLETIKNEAKNPNLDDWPAKERWEANLTVKDYIGYFDGLYKTQIKHLKIVWFLDGGDPMAELEKIIGKLDFNALCSKYIEESYD